MELFGYEPAGRRTECAKWVSQLAFGCDRARAELWPGNKPGNKLKIES